MFVDNLNRVICLYLVLVYTQKRYWLFQLVFVIKLDLSRKDHHHHNSSDDSSGIVYNPALFYGRAAAENVHKCIHAFKKRKRIISSSILTIFLLLYQTFIQPFNN